MHIIYDRTRDKERWFVKGKWVEKPPECGGSYPAIFARWLCLGCPGTILEMRYALVTYYRDELLKH